MFHYIWPTRTNKPFDWKTNLTGCYGQGKYSMMPLLETLTTKKDKWYMQKQKKNIGTYIWCHCTNYEKYFCYKWIIASVTKYDVKLASPLELVTGAYNLFVLLLSSD